LDALETYIDALRALAKPHEANRVVLIERNIDRYLQMESGRKQRGHLVEQLRVIINNEEAERRQGEDWSIAKNYVQSLLRKMP
jgi:hypothetical protein